MPINLRSFRLWFLLVVGLFLFTRLAVLERSPHLIHDIDTAECWHAELAHRIFSASGNWLNKLSAGFSPGSLFQEYMKNPHSGGTFVLSLLYVPVAYFFGLSYLSLKSFALAFSLATLIAWLLFLRRWFGKTAAVWCGLLLTFPAEIEGRAPHGISR